MWVTKKVVFLKTLFKSQIKPKLNSGWLLGVIEQQLLNLIPC